MRFAKPVLRRDALARYWLALLHVAWSFIPCAEAQPIDPDRPVLEVFEREGCPHCADAKDNLPAFAAERPWLRIVYRSLDTDLRAREDLVRHSQSAGIWPPGVPTFVIDDKVLVGFEDAAQTGAALAALVAHRAPGATSKPASVETTNA